MSEAEGSLFFALIKGGCSFPSALLADLGILIHLFDWMRGLCSSTPSFCQNLGFHEPPAFWTSGSWNFQGDLSHSLSLTEKTPIIRKQLDTYIHKTRTPPTRCLPTYTYNHLYMNIPLYHIISL